MKRSITILCLAAIPAAIGCLNSLRADDKEEQVLPGRHLSESQVAGIALKNLPSIAQFRCEFADGTWTVLAVQKNVWGVSSVTTNSDGKIAITSTNATVVVLKVRDADGKVEPVKTP